jgi:hypothetical protein
VRYVRTLQDVSCSFVMRKRERNKFKKLLIFAKARMEFAGWKCPQEYEKFSDGTGSNGEIKDPWRDLCRKKVTLFQRE